MQKLFLTCAFLISLSVCFSQTKEIDSLLNLLQQHKTNDKTRAILLKDISYSYHIVDPHKGIAYADAAILIAKKSNDSSLLGRSYQAKGVNYWARSQFDSALYCYGIALGIFEKRKDEQGMAATYNSFGIVLKDLGDFPVSLEYHFKALHLYEQLNDESGKADVLTNIGLVYNKVNQHNKALNYFNNALEILKVINEKNGMANALSNIASTFEYLDKPDSTLVYYEKSFRLYKTMGNKFGIASCLLNISIAEINMGQYDSAWDKLHEAERLLSELGDKNNLSLLCYQAASLYSEAGENLLSRKGIVPSQRNEKVLNWISKGIELAKQTGSLERQSLGLNVLSLAYGEQKRPVEALNALREYVDLNEKIYNDSKMQEVTRQEVQYEFNRRQDSIKAVTDKQQALAAAQIKQQQTIRNAVVAGVVIILLAAALLFISYKKRRDAQEQQKEAEFNAQVTDTEMKALRTQMNPHFIFNSLNSINDYIDKNETSTATVFTTKFARLMRMILENSEQKEVLLEDDLKALELYMQLESLRMKNKFTYEIKVDEAIDPQNALVPPLILQPFVENSIWHGIAKKEGEGKINIRIRKEGEMINCIVEDNGIGRSNPDNTRTETGKNAKQSLGMKITKARIEILNKIKKTNAGIELTDLIEGFKVEVRLPYELSF